VVVTLDGGQVIETQIRRKMGHQHFAGQPHERHDPGQPRGYGTGPRARHAAMMGAISDCQVLLARGMGWGAYEALREMGLDAVVTDVVDIEEAALRYAQGNLPNLRERLH
jgi:predicted Fe-Mo cluster-binding NifX family protein